MTIIQRPSAVRKEREHFRRDSLLSTIVELRPEALLAASHAPHKSIALTSLEILASGPDRDVEMLDDRIIFE
jgi:hypothetical protein